MCNFDVHEIFSERKAFMKRPLCVVCLAVVACIALWVWLYPPVAADFGDADGGEVTLIGRVYAKDFQRGYNAPILLLYVEPSVLLYQNQEIPFYENFICRLQDGGAEPVIGSSVTVTGILTEFTPATNPGQFDEQLYYATLGFSARINEAVVVQENAPQFNLRENLWQFRKKLGEGIDTIFEPEDAAILKAMLLGDKSSLPADTKEIYQESGIMHILAISGLHISVLGMGLYRILHRLHLPRKLSATLCAVVMVLYGIMVGMPVSAVRAIIMFLFRLAAEWKGRTYDLLTALAVSAVLLLVEQPLYLLNAGFLLSFSAVAAIVLLKPRLLPPIQETLVERGISHIKDVPRSLDNLSTSLSILIFTLPVQLFFYYEISVYAPFFNLLVLPLVGAVLAAGVGAISAMWLLHFLPLLTRVLALFVHWILNAYEQGGRAVRSLAGAILTPGCPEPLQIVCYAIALTAVIFLKKLRWRFRVGLLCGAILILTAQTHQGFTVTMLDVGQGQCICLRLPDGSAWLYDGGSLDVSQAGTYRIEPYLKSQGIRTLDAVFLSHGDTDHISGVVEMLENGDITIELLALPCAEKESAYTAESGFAELVLLAEHREIPILWMEEGMTWENAEVSVQCLHPGPDSTLAEGNANSMVLYFTYGDFSMLLTGDVEEEGEEELLQALQENAIEQVTVLQVAHHGSKYSSSTHFLEQVSPQLALISCGEGNFYGHPHEETLQRLKEVGSVMLTTPESGAITIEIGEEIRLRRWGIPTK